MLVLNDNTGELQLTITYKKENPNIEGYPYSFVFKVLNNGEYIPACGGCSTNIEEAFNKTKETMKEIIKQIELEETKNGSE